MPNYRSLEIRRAELRELLGVDVYTWGEVRRLAPTAALATMGVVEHVAMIEEPKRREWVLGILRKKTGRTLWRLEGGRAWLAHLPPKRMEEQTCWLCGVRQESKWTDGMCFRCWSWSSHQDPYHKTRNTERAREYRQRVKNNNKH